MLKSTYAKLEPKILRKRFYKDFNKESFLKDLQQGLNNNGKFTEFNDKFKAILNHHSPTNQSNLGGNTKSHINKTLRKETTKRSRLKNKAYKADNEEDKRLYYIQRNKASKLINLKKHMLNRTSERKKRKGFLELL